MSLINDMLKDLDRRNQLSTDSPAIPLTVWGLADKHGHKSFIQRFVAQANARILIAVALAGISLFSSMLVQNARSPNQTQFELDLKNTNKRDLSKNSYSITNLEPSRQPKNNTIENPPELLQNKKNDSLHTVPPSIDRTPESPNEAQLKKSFAGYNEVTAWGTVKITEEHIPETDNSRNVELASLPQSSAKQSSLFRKVANELTEGNVSNAQHLLEDLLSKYKDQHKARLLLAKIYIQQQLEGRAESLLATSLIDYPQYAPYAKLYGQILAKQGRDSEAIHAVRTALPTVSTDADYHALLAGLYQRSENPIAAANSYRDALRLAPEHGEWWMGMAIANEQAGKSGLAKRAYRQALQLPTSPSAQQYAEKRLQQLTIEQAVNDNKQSIE